MISDRRIVTRLKQSTFNIFRYFSTYLFLAWKYSICRALFAVKETGHDARRFLDDSNSTRPSVFKLVAYHFILSPCACVCCRRALRATRPLRLVALSKRSRVSLAGGQLQVHVCTRLYWAELRGRHRRMRQEPVQTRLLQEHSRILQVSRTTSLTLSPALYILYPL